ncbi:AraC family transcriptional regulator [Saccharomonospora sp. CUA-673]|uniref:DJ-1/PfpI family protein n=1 Tax=Saccharomonospora sp. CUA-673 TaxID=1904969 RepID=UPI000968EF37|nr:DJ-1/PfpI family protein [Saccharomonospora sp. CUA-673]OLT42671.1 AraC family transcriptional regulator [Saccharomonospora sp. CUA-673]
MSESTEPAAVRAVAVLLPNLTQLDLTGPAQVLSATPGVVLDLAWRTTDPVRCDGGWSIIPTVTFDEAPQADLLLVPGGQGAFEVLTDDAVLEFVRRQARGARWVTSVCTGSFVLAAAGLLTGRRATTHWASLPMLAEFGVAAVSERVVVDGNVITGGGITAGIDFGLTLAAEIAGEDVAREVQLRLEYDPAPPFDSGTPDGFGAEAAAAIGERTRQARRPLVDAALRHLRG